jgi:hypothetical protein
MSFLQVSFPSRFILHLSPSSTLPRRLVCTYFIHRLLASGWLWPMVSGGKTVGKKEGDTGLLFPQLFILSNDSSSSFTQLYTSKLLYPIYPVLWYLGRTLLFYCLFCFPEPLPLRIVPFKNNHFISVSILSVPLFSVGILSDTIQMTSKCLALFWVSLLNSSLF